jgi:predicted phosphodiesterase
VKSSTRIGVFVGLAALAAVIVGAIVVSQWGGRAGLTAGPMVQMVGPDGFTLVWFQGEANNATVRVRPYGDAAWAIEKTIKPTDGRGEVRIDGLNGSADYEYEIVAAGGAPEPLASGRTRTAPGRDEPFTFLAFGDSGWGQHEQFEVAALMAKQEFAMAVHTGDVVYLHGKDEHYPHKFFEPYAPWLGRAPIYPCLGNHDWDSNEGEPFFRRFTLPANGPAGVRPEEFYWFDYGDVRFVCLNSNEPFGVLQEKMVPWLDAALRDAGDQWKIVYYHHAVYTSGKYEPSGKMLQLAVPLFDRYGVALALQGHNHMYERTHPIHDNAVVEPGEGTVYVTTGAGGAPLYELREPVPDYMAVQFNTDYSFTLVDVSRDSLDVRQIRRDGETIDTFTIPRARSAEAEGAPATGTADTPGAVGVLAE